MCEESLALPAFALLRETQKVGYFRDPAHRDLLAKDADLNELRSRMEFRQWIQDVEKGK